MCGGGEVQDRAKITCLRMRVVQLPVNQDGDYLRGEIIRHPVIAKDLLIQGNAKRCYIARCIPNPSHGFLWWLTTLHLALEPSSVQARPAYSQARNPSCTHDSFSSCETLDILYPFPRTLESLYCSAETCLSPIRIQRPSKASRGFQHRLNEGETRTTRVQRLT